MTQDVGIMSTRGREFAEDLKAFLNAKFHIAVRVRARLRVKKPKLTRSAGKTWILQGTSCLLKVPSAILPEETNFVLDPRHPDAQNLRLVKERAFQFDPRLVESGPRP